LYRDRVALEREYAGKLQILAKKAAEKKSKMEASVVVGLDPTKAWDESILKQRSILSRGAFLSRYQVDTSLQYSQRSLHGHHHLDG
jgi:hypothetical protein